MNPIKVSYLLGAGASYGKRKDKTDRKDEGDFMIEGIPVVAETKLYHFIFRIVQYSK